MACGFADELHQKFIPGRSPELDDLLLDVWGGTIGAVMYLMFAGVDRALLKTGNGFMLRAGVLGALASLAMLVGIAPYMVSNFGSTFANKAKNENFVHVRTAAANTSVHLHTLSHESGSKGNEYSLSDSKQFQLSAIASERLYPAATAIITLNKTTNQNNASPEETNQTNYIRKFVEALAEAEADHADMIVYSKDFPRKALNARKIERLRNRIDELKREVPEVGIDATTSNYIGQLKAKLAELEVKDIDMMAFSTKYPRRAILKRKIAILNYRIAQIERTGSVRIADTVEKDCPGQIEPSNRGERNLKHASIEPVSPSGDSESDPKEISLTDKRFSMVWY
jgi:hypothetical protein